MTEQIKFTFDDQRPNEDVLLVCRQHPWVLAKRGLVLIFIVLLIVAAFLIWGASFNSTIALVAGLVIGGIYAFLSWFIYSNVLFILTNERLITITQKSLFSRKETHVELDNIYVTNCEIEGFFKSMLNFGDVKVSTQGEDISLITIKNIEKPHYVQEQIVKARKILVEGQKRQPPIIR